MIRITRERKGVLMPILTHFKWFQHTVRWLQPASMDYFTRLNRCQIQSLLFTIIYQKYWRHSISCSNKLIPLKRRKLNFTRWKPRPSLMLPTIVGEKDTIFLFKSMFSSIVFSFFFVQCIQNLYNSSHKNNKFREKVKN